MKSKDKSELQSKTSAELKKTAAALRIQINKDILEMAARRGKNTNEAKNLRKKLAVVLTYLRGKELIHG